MDNKVFFQHPDLMRALCVHETVMQLMVNTLNKAQLQQQASAGAAPQDPSASQSQKPPHSSMDALTEQSKVGVERIARDWPGFLCWNNLCSRRERLCVERMVVAVIKKFRVWMLMLKKACLKTHSGNDALMGIMVRLSVLMREWRNSIRIGLCSSSSCSKDANSGERKN